MIEIKEEQDGKVSIRADKGTKWNTFIVGIELMIETLLDNSKAHTTIDDILADVKRIYERDRNENIN